jgi:hypothetical protein
MGLIIDRLAERFGTDNYMIERSLLLLMRAVILVLPQFFYFGIPFATQVFTQDFFDVIDALPAGANVLIFFEASVEYFEMEGGFGGTAVMNHLYSKDVNFVVTSFSPNGALVFPKFFDQPNWMLPKWGETGYGDDYVYLGMIPGGQSPQALQALAEQGLDLFPVDNWGTDIKTMPIYQQGLNHITRFDLIITAAQGQNVMNFLVIPFNMPWVAAGSPMIRFYPHILKGFISNIRSIGEYEGLTKLEPSPAAKALDVVSIGTLWMVGVVVYANISSYLKDKEKEKELEEGQVK